MSSLNIDRKTLRRLVDSGTEADFQQLWRIYSGLVQLTTVTEGSGAPTYAAEVHSQYFDTATKKYYRNVDGGTTWVALN